MTPTPNTPNEVDELEAWWIIATEGLYTESGYPPDALTPESKTTLQAIITKQTAAYGGCFKCYGKGYATWRHGETYHGRSTNMRTEMKYCTCNRGKQLEQLVTKQQALYHAAGLRELKTHEHKTMDTRGQHRTHMVSFHYIDQAIAREESK